MTLQKNLNRLQQLPLFHFSLSSKELFHSNFIAWLFNSYKDQASVILKAMLYKEDSNLSFIQARREKEKNKDIIFDIMLDGRPLKVIVENKVKSLPSLEQLQKYSSNGNAFFGILLSLVKPAFMTTEKTIVINEVTWEWYNYQEFSKQLQKHLSFIQLENAYHGNILSEYIEFLDLLCQIPMDVDWQHGMYDFSKISLYSNLSELRIHDLFEKVIHQQLGQRLNDVLKNKYSDVIYSSKWQLGKEDQLYVFDAYGGYSGALAEVKYMVGSGINVGIQVQRGALNLSAEATDSKLAFQFANDLFNKNLWFDFSLAKCSYSKVYPVKKNITFKNYDQTFFYRAIELPVLPYHELIAIFESYLHVVLNNKDQIKACIHIPSL